MYEVLAEYEASSHFVFASLIMNLTLRVAEQSDRMNLFLDKFLNH